MRCVILESPYAGVGSNWVKRLIDRWKNRMYARACMRDAINNGDAPLASHVLYAQSGVLNDDITHERGLGIEAGLAWLPRAEASVVYIDRGVSNGMKYGIARARSLGVPVEFRSLFDGGHVVDGYQGETIQ